MRIFIILLALAFACAPLATQAEEISYSYLEAGYVNVDVDDFDEDVDGFLLRGSFEITENAFLFAGYSDLMATINGFDIDFTDIELGAGYAWPLSNTASLYGKISYVNSEAEAFGESLDDDGYGLAAGVRGLVAPSFELEGYISYVDLSDLGDNTAFGAAARYYFMPQFALGVEAVFDDDATSYGIGFRWHWGN